MAERWEMPAELKAGLIEQLGNEFEFEKNDAESFIDRVVMDEDRLNISPEQRLLQIRKFDARLRGPGILVAREVTKSKIP